MNSLRPHLIAWAIFGFCMPVHAQIYLPPAQPAKPPVAVPDKRPAPTPQAIAPEQPSRSGVNPVPAPIGITAPDPQSLPSPGGRGNSNNNDLCRNLTAEEKAGITICNSP